MDGSVALILFNMEMRKQAKQQEQQQLPCNFRRRGRTSPGPGPCTRAKREGEERSSMFSYSSRSQTLEGLYYCRPYLHLMPVFSSGLMTWLSRHVTQQPNRLTTSTVFTIIPAPGVCVGPKHSFNPLLHMESHLRMSVNHGKLLFLQVLNQLNK